MSFIYCKWKSCGGVINPDTDRCIMCGHTLDIDKEVSIEKKKAMVKTDWHTNSTESEKKSRLRRVRLEDENKGGKFYDISGD